MAAENRIPGEHDISNAMKKCFISVNVQDSNMETANIVDVLDDIAKALWEISRSLKKGD